MRGLFLFLRLFQIKPFVLIYLVLYGDSVTMIKRIYESVNCPSPKGGGLQVQAHLH